MAITAALLLPSAQPAHGFGLLDRLAEKAKRKLEEKAEQAIGGIENAGKGAAGGSREGTSSRSASAAPAVMTPRAVRGGAPRGDAPASGARAAPAAAPAASVRYPSELPRPAGFEAVKATFTEFGKVACFSCEGGFGYDSWPSFPRDGLSGKYNESGKRLGALPVGHVHRWKGVQSSGTLTVLAEETVGGLRCKKLQYRLAKGGASAERPGLVCWGYANGFAGSEDWNEVY
ncbi:MAG TPA: hypothetical protein VEZ48_01035 [Sphingomonadaceae bacterium]|nr:hypothetical protein [Sphingomonadaceae bacterium]